MPNAPPMPVAAESTNMPLDELPESREVSLTNKENVRDRAAEDLAEEALATLLSLQHQKMPLVNNAQGSRLGQKDIGSLLMDGRTGWLPDRLTPEDADADLRAASMPSSPTRATNDTLDALLEMRVARRATVKGREGRSRSDPGPRFGYSLGAQARQPGDWTAASRLFSPYAPPLRLEQQYQRQQQQLRYAEALRRDSRLVFQRNATSFSHPMRFGGIQSSGQMRMEARLDVGAGTTLTQSAPTSPTLSHLTTNLIQAYRKSSVGSARSQRQRVHMCPHPNCAKIFPSQSRLKRHEKSHQTGTSSARSAEQ